MQLKPGVRILGLKPEAVVGMMIAKEAVTRRGFAFVITSVVDGTHSKGSLHYCGYAFDVRTGRAGIESGEAHEIAGEIREHAGADFDVIVHDGTHIHVEYQPKTPL